MRALERLERHARAGQELRQAEAELAPARAAQQRREREAAAVQQQARQVVQQLGRVYRDPAAAWERVQAEAAKIGPAEVGKRLREAPEGYGELIGRGIGPIRTAERRQAIQAAAEIAPAAIQATAAARGEARQPRRVQIHETEAFKRTQELRAELRDLGGRRELVREVVRAGKEASEPQRQALEPHHRAALRAAQEERQQGRVPERPRVRTRSRDDDDGRGR